MKYRISILALLITAVLAQSCVSSKKYKELDANYTQLQNSTRDLSVKYQTSEQALAVANSRNKSLEEQIAQQKNNVVALQDASAIS
jgi:chemotaxis protein MotB